MKEWMKRELGIKLKTAYKMKKGEMIVRYTETWREKCYAK